MNHTRLTINVLISTLAACLFPLAIMAQVEDPHVTGNVPITFYGKVVDQHDQPVPDVTVRLEIRVGYFTSPTSGKERWDTVRLTSDKSGVFVLTNVNGGFIQFNSIEKNGYKLSPKQVKANFLYYPQVFHPEPANPVVFKMWKKAGEEQLVGSAWHGKVACDGTTNHFDLHNGHSSAEGVLEIICTRTPLNFEMTSRQPFDYKLIIAISGGSIQPTEDEFTYLAPESGYLSSVTIDRKPGDPKWGGGLMQEFYVKTDKGEYGRLSVEWDAGHRPAPTSLKWECTINPSGSRNLER